jgi:hypothetical protein
VRVLFDVDIEIDCAVPSAPLIAGDHFVVAGGEVALLALVHKETGTVEKALFNNEPDVDVFAPVVVSSHAQDDESVEFAFASIDRPRLQLRVSIVDRHLRMLRTRDISADDPETPELLVEGRITHFSAQGEGDDTALVVAVRDDDPAPRRGAITRILRSVRGDDLLPRWAWTHDDVVVADRGIVVVQRGFQLRGLGSDGQERWTHHIDAHGLEKVVGAGAGALVIAHHDEDEDDLPSTLDVRDIATGNSTRTVAFDSSLRARAAHPHGALLTYAQRDVQHVLMHTDAQTDEHMIDVPAHVVAEDVAIVGTELLLWPLDEKRPTVVPLQLSARARAAVDGALVVLRDGKRLIALEK